MKRGEKEKQLQTVGARVCTHARLKHVKRRTDPKNKKIRRQEQWDINGDTDAEEGDQGELKDSEATTNRRPDLQKVNKSKIRESQPKKVRNHNLTHTGRDSESNALNIQSQQNNPGNTGGIVNAEFTRLTITAFL